MARQNDVTVRARAIQAAWARKQGIEIDPQGYTFCLEDNLFQPLNAATRAELTAGAGAELGVGGARGKLQALHSSAALAVNVFDYWRDRQREPLAEALSLESPIVGIQFERTFPTGMRGTPPHLDVTLTTGDGRIIAIESKFLEVYPAKSRTAAFRDTYFPADGGRWVDGGLPACQRVAEALQLGERMYRYLDAPQLLKHSLGLANTAGAGCSLWYIWYDVGGEEGAIHRQEITEFSDCLDPELRFRTITYQELIARLATECGPADSLYIDYLSSRYGRDPVNATAGEADRRARSPSSAQSRWLE